MQVYVPTTVAEALALRASHQPAYFLGGGTLINGSRWRAEGDLVSLQALGLEGITFDGDRCVIGSMTTWSDVARCDDLADWDFLRRACRDLGRVNIRNQATVGGALGGGQTFSDLIPALMIADAELTIQRDAAGKPETLSLEDWFACAPKEKGLVLAVSCSRPDEADRFGRARLSRNAGDIATMKLLCRLRVEAGRVSEARVALAVAGLPVQRLDSMEDLLEGFAVDGELEGLERRAAKIAAEAKPAADVRGSRPFKKKIMSVLIMDAIREALGRGGEVR